ncbi:hypothetical protein GCM10010255_81160 [Streptomyces coeruleofuscus]|uniref:Uncharacterized protein n=1 Tax=Streptomyces coeruleofuscus TaxID=66879 RepID=A0ABN3JEN5_9ACTN
MSHSKHTLAVIHKDADTASSWVNGQLSSSDYFAQARQAAAARGIAGRLLCAVREAYERLTHRA